jgi:predicted flap endonuclease-1-like 5' DNA nuclease
MTQLNSLTAKALSVAQAAQQDSVAGIPGWVIILIVLLVLIGVVIWVMYYQGKKDTLPGHAATPAPVKASTPVTAPAKPDDLTLIEGIGPKIAGLLQAAGITTFSQLAAADVNQLKQVLTAAKLDKLANPATWPEQAQLAAAGDREGLQKLQDMLKGGRRV